MNNVIQEVLIVAAYLLADYLFFRFLDYEQKGLVQRLYEKWKASKKATKTVG